MYAEWVSIRSKVALLRAHARCLTGAAIQRDPFTSRGSELRGISGEPDAEWDEEDAGEVTWSVVTSAQEGFAPKLQQLWLALL